MYRYLDVANDILLIKEDDNDRSPYEIRLDELTTEKERALWINHMRLKRWFTDEHMTEFKHFLSTLCNTQT